VVIVIIVIFSYCSTWRATCDTGGHDSGFADRNFAFIKIFGFSINSLRLFGITLATGLVVDDAIVVIENAQRHITEDKPTRIRPLPLP